MNRRNFLKQIAGTVASTVLPIPKLEAPGLDLGHAVAHNGAPSSNWANLTPTQILDDNVYHEFMKDFAAAAQIPYEILFGRESGLGSNVNAALAETWSNYRMETAMFLRCSLLSATLERMDAKVAMPLRAETWGTDGC